MYVSRISLLGASVTRGLDISVTLIHVHSTFGVKFVLLIECTPFQPSVRLRI